MSSAASSSRSRRREETVDANGEAVLGIEPEGDSRPVGGRRAIVATQARHAGAQKRVRRITPK